MSAGPQDIQKLYQQSARTIAAAIEDGRYAPGDRLPFGKHARAPGYTSEQRRMLGLRTEI